MKNALRRGRIKAECGLKDQAKAKPRSMLQSDGPTYNRWVPHTQNRLIFIAAFHTHPDSMLQYTIMRHPGPAVALTCIVLGLLSHCHASSCTTDSVVWVCEGPVLPGRGHSVGVVRGWCGRSVGGRGLCCLEGGVVWAWCGRGVGVVRAHGG
eukprot:197745-Chlamydomonas_euryale.AAC.1